MSIEVLIPDPEVLIMGLRDTGYDSNTALADVVDNSVDAGATCIKVSIQLDRNNNPTVMIADNGCGMNAEDAKKYLEWNDLVKKGLPFRTAYKITGSIVGYAIDNDKTLDTITIDEYKQFSDLIDEDIYEYIDLKKAVCDRTVVGGPAPETVKKHVEEIKKFLETI